MKTLRDLEAFVEATGAPLIIQRQANLWTVQTRRHPGMGFSGTSLGDCCQRMADYVEMNGGVAPKPVVHAPKIADEHMPMIEAALESRDWSPVLAWLESQASVSDDAAVLQVGVVARAWVAACPGDRSEETMRVLRKLGPVTRRFIDLVGR